MFFSKPAKNGGGVTSLTGTPTEIVYIDNAGVGTSDGLATRDSVTNETYIGYRTSGGDFSNGFHLGNILGGALSDGAAFQRHDAVNDNFTFIGTVDSTPFGGSTNALLGGYADLVNGITSVFTLDEVGTDLTYGNDVLGVGGTIKINDTEASIDYGDGTTFGANTIYNATGIQTTYINQSTNRQTQFVVNDGFVAGGDRFGSGNDMTFNLDDNTQQFYVRGLKHGGNLGDMLNLNAQFGTMRMGDVTNISSHVKIGVDNSNATAYIDGLAKTVPNWTPTILTDGFTGTGLNDMHYVSTITYTGSYPRTYTSTISATDCVYLLLTSIISPSFNFGDTVTDPVSGSTGTVLAGSDLDLYLIIQPIIDSGWNTATQVDDITTGGSANCSFQRYTDTFDWNDGTTFETYRDTNTFVPLNDGLTVGFYSPTGHTIGDSWTWEMIANYTYSKMALFDGFNGIQVIGDVNEALDGIRTEWVHDTTKGGSITEYLGEQGTFNVSSNAGNIFNVTAVDTSTSGDVIIYNPYSGSGYDLFRAVFDNAGLGIGIRVSDNGSQRSVLIGDDVGFNNGTNILVDDIAETITLTASHISAPLSAYADDADAGTNGVVTGELYQTDGTGTAPLNIAGIVMIKQ